MKEVACVVGFCAVWVGAKENPKKRELKGAKCETEMIILDWCKGKSQETGIERLLGFVSFAGFLFSGCKGKSQETGIERSVKYKLLGKIVARCKGKSQETGIES